MIDKVETPFASFLFLIYTRNSKALDILRFEPDRPEQICRWKKKKDYSVTHIDSSNTIPVSLFEALLVSLYLLRMYSLLETERALGRRKKHAREQAQRE